MLSIAIRLGAVETLEKPFQPAELLAAVARALNLESRTA
jgi:DNA-binding NtrC family response regulator